MTTTLPSDSAAFEELVSIFRMEYERFCGRSCSRASVYFDAIRYDLYGVVPFYLEVDMNDDIVLRYCADNNMSTAQFFRMAHIWYFFRDVDVTIDVERYNVENIVPIYVQIYLAKCA